MHDQLFLFSFRFWAICVVALVIVEYDLQRLRKRYQFFDKETVTQMDGVLHPVSMLLKGYMLSVRDLFFYFTMATVLFPIGNLRHFLLALASAFTYQKFVIVTEVNREVVTKVKETLSGNSFLVRIVRERMIGASWFFDGVLEKVLP